MKKLLSSPQEVNPEDLDVRIAMIQALMIPIALEAVGERLTQELEELAGNRYSRKEGDLRRWGGSGDPYTWADRRSRSPCRESGISVPEKRFLWPHIEPCRGPER